MPKPDKDRKRTKDIGSLMERQEKEALKAVTSRRYSNHEEDESDSEEEIKFSKKELLALLKKKNLRKISKSNSSKQLLKTKKDKEEDSEDSLEETSGDEQEEEKEEKKIEKTHSKSKFNFFDFHLKLKDLDNYIVNAKNVADVRSKANLIQRIRREHEEYKDKDPSVKDFSVFFSKYSEENEVYTIILGLDPEDSYEEWFLKTEKDCFKLSSRQ